MKLFKDNTGRDWSLSLTIGTVARVRGESGKRYDLLSPSGEVDGKPLFELLTEDLVECWQVLAHIVAPQLKERGLTAEQFGEVMSADCLLAAQDSLLEEWADFFRQAQRQDVAAALDMMRAGKRKLRATVAKKLEAAELDATRARMEAAIETACGKSFGSLQDSLDAILKT